MRMIDEVGFKEMPEDTRYIQILHRNETWGTGSVGKLNIMDSLPDYMPLLGTADSGMGRISLHVGPWLRYEIHTQGFRPPQDC